MTIETVIFDLDGTLVDTELAASHAIRDSFESWGLRVDPLDARYIAGRTWKLALEFLAQKYQFPVSLEEVSNEMLTRYRKNLHTHLIIVPGAAEAVRALAGAVPLGLVSGSSRSEIFFALEKLKIADLFQTILGCEDYPRSKPAPDGYLKALTLMNAKPERTLVFEDSEAGIASARSAGMPVVAICSTNHFGQDNRAAQVFIDDLRPVTLSWLKGLVLPEF